MKNKLYEIINKVFNYIWSIMPYYLLFVVVVLAISLVLVDLRIGLLILVGAIALYELEKTNNHDIRIKVKYFAKDLEKIQKISKGDWIDLRSAEDVTLLPGEYYAIRLGVGMILPKGYEAHVLPRSSTPSKFGIMLANSQGVIDNSFSGDGDEWHFPAIALRHTVIRKGDRICQFRIVKNQPEIKIVEVDHLNAISRGGLGSTGKR